QAPLLRQTVEFRYLDFAEPFSLLKEPQPIAYHFTGVVVASADQELLHKGLEPRSQRVAARHRRPSIRPQLVSLNITTPRAVKISGLNRLAVRRSQVAHLGTFSVRAVVTAICRTRLFPFVGVEDGPHLLGIDGGRRDAGPLDLQQLAHGAVAC